MRAYQKRTLFCFIGIQLVALSQEIPLTSKDPGQTGNFLYLESFPSPQLEGRKDRTFVIENGASTSASQHICQHNTLSSGDQTKVYFMRLYNEYAPQYKAFIDSNYCGPGCYFIMVDNQRTEASSDTTKDQLFDSFGTVVHETSHTFNNRNKLMIEPGVVVDFMPTETVYSENIASIVPADASEKIFRYKSYVGAGSGVSANKNGIYGLMDEFTAYRNGTKACTDAASVARSKGNAKRTEEFLKLATQTYFACYEFRLFIGWYLEYLEKAKPQAYTALINNTNFRVTYTLIEQGFLSDIKTMETLIKQTPSAKWYYDYYEENYAVYCKEHLPEVEAQLSALRVEGVNKTNFRQFLKKVTYY